MATARAGDIDIHCDVTDYTDPWRATETVLLHHGFELAVLEYPRCFGRPRIIAAIHPPEAIRGILDCLGLPSRPPPRSSAVSDVDMDEQAFF